MSMSSINSDISNYSAKDLEKNVPTRMYSQEIKEKDGRTKFDTHRVSRVVTTHGFNGDEVIIIGESKVLKSELLGALGLQDEKHNNDLVPVLTGSTLTKVPSRKPTVKYGIAPAALGLSAFAATTFLLSLYNCGTLGIRIPHVIVGMAFFYGGLVQLLAGMWEYVVGSSFGGLAFTSYAGFWLSYGAILTESFGITAAFAGEPDQLNNALGLYLVTWAMFTFFMLMCTLKTTLEFFMLFFLLLVTFVLLAAHALTGVETCQHVAGVFGVVTALIAWYNGFKMMLNSHNSYFVMPSIWLPHSHVKEA